MYFVCGIQYLHWYWAAKGSGSGLDAVEKGKLGTLEEQVSGSCSPLVASQ